MFVSTKSHFTFSPKSTNAMAGYFIAKNLCMAKLKGIENTFAGSKGSLSFCNDRIKDVCCVKVDTQYPLYCLQGLTLRIGFKNLIFCNVRKCVYRVGLQFSLCAVKTTLWPIQKIGMKDWWLFT